MPAADVADRSIAMDITEESFSFIFIYKNNFLSLHPWHMEVPGLGVELEL